MKITHGGIDGRRNGRAAALAAGVAALAAVFAPADVPAASADLDRSSAELAAALVLRDLREELRAKPADAAALRDAMLADPAPNADPADAERNMALVHSNELARVFAGEARALLDRLAAPAPRTDRFPAAFLAEAETAPPEDLAAATAAAFPAAFRQARDEAVRAQAARIEASVRPDPAEVETRPRDELAGDLAVRIERAQSFAVFRENRETIARTLVGPILDDAFLQREAQRAFVRDAGPAAAGFAPSAIATNLAAALFARLGERRAAAPDAFVYGPFPSATGEVARAAAEARLAARFAAEAGRAAVPLDEDAVRAALAADPAAHRRRDDSLAAFEPALRDAVRAAATASLLALAPEAERGECEAFLRDRAGDELLARPVAERVRAEAGPRLDAVRAAVADGQLRAALPALAAGTWLPDEASVDAVCAAENDFRKTLRAWRRTPVPALAAIDAAAPADRLLEEAAAKLDGAVLAAFEPGAAARASQHKAVDALYGEMERAVAALGKAPPLEQVVRIYTARAAAAWAEAREGVLGAGAAETGRYQDLFPSTHAKIELLSKTLLEAAEREEARPETPPEPTPPQPDAPPDEPRAIPLECDFVFDRKDGAFEVSVRADARELGRFSCPAEPGAFGRTVDGFADEAAGALAALLRERTKRGPVALKVNVVVRDGLIYWAAVSGVSGSVRQAVRSFGDAVAAEFAEPASAR